MENKEKYIQRIKKLLAMARNNSSVEEAALALRRAQRLMETHKLTEADADLIDINEASTQKAPSHAEKMPEYMAILAEMVARVFGVKFYTSHGTEQWGKPAKRTIHYYGPDERPQIAAYSFEVLVSNWRKPAEITSPHYARTSNRPQKLPAPIPSAPPGQRCLCRCQ